jgi:Uma2 family endonuclease
MTVELRHEALSSETKPLPAGPITYEEFLEWADEDTYAEWVDGKVEFMSPASTPHQRALLFLARLFAEWLERHEAGEVLVAPFPMRLRDIRRGREPDILVLFKDTASRLQRNYLDGSADLVVEIVSPESVQRDWQDKYAEYEAAGVREYWIIDPDPRRANFFVHGDAGRFEPATPNEEGRYDCRAVPGFWINVGWLWQEPLPTLRQVLAAWGM